MQVLQGIKQLMDLPLSSKTIGKMLIQEKRKEKDYQCSMKSMSINKVSLCLAENSVICCTVD